MVDTNTKYENKNRLIYLDYKVINDIMEIPLKQEGSLSIT